MSFLFKVVLLFYFLRCGYFVEGFGLLQNVQYSDKCLHVKGSSRDNNGATEITACDPSQTDQQLNVEAWTDYVNNPGQIIFQFNQKCLTVSANGLLNGDPINQYDCSNGAANQLWKIVGSYDANFQIQNVGSLKCLTAEGSGTYTDQWDCLGETAAPHQTWRIVQSGGSQASSSGGGVFGFENVQYAGKCLNAADGISGMSSNLNVYDCDTTSSTQLFTATNLASISGSITLYGTNLCLNVYGESQSNGGQIGTYSCSTNNAQNEIWSLTFDDNHSSAFQIVSVFSGKCLTVESSGTWIDQWDCLSYESAPHQWWQFKSLSSPPSGIPTTGSLLESASYPNRCLRIQGRSGDNNAELQLMSCNAADSAQVLNMNSLAWDDLSSSSGSISFQSSSKCLTVIGAGTDNGVHVNQYDCVNPAPGNQQWQLITANNSGYEELFELKNVGSGKCLTAEGTGSYLDQWDCYDYESAPHQFWRIRPIDASSSGGSHDDFSSYWQCYMDTGLLTAKEEQYRNWTCGMYCVYGADKDGQKGFTGGYCYRGWWNYNYCACVSAPLLNDRDVQLYKSINYEGTPLFIGSKLRSQNDCISFDDPAYSQYDNGALKSILYELGVCIKLWANYKCTGGTGNRAFIYRRDVLDHYKLGDIPNRVGGVRSMSRIYC